MESALRPLEEHLECDDCKQALRDRIKNLVVQWSIVKVPSPLYARLMRSNPPHSARYSPFITPTWSPLWVLFFLGGTLAKTRSILPGRRFPAPLIARPALQS